MSKKIYRDYFNIDPKYYAAVTADLIDSGKVSWKNFYPHETFVKLLEKTYAVLSGADPRSLWVEGAYGTGKSHAALTVKSLLEASDEELEEYFNDYGLKKDLCQKLISVKNKGQLITIHRIGSASIHSDQDLILAIQDSVMAALSAHGIENRGEASLKDAALGWLEKDANRKYFNDLISEEQYSWNFGGDVNSVINRLRTGSADEVSKLMRSIFSVAEDNGITALRLDIPGMANWLKSIIEENHLSAILFIWDEFTEFFQNNPNSLTGFQTLAEISLSHPFYFMIVTHESRSLFVNNETAKKILDRFVPPVKIELPENMAFRLMAQAMKTTGDHVLREEWEGYKDELNGYLADVRASIRDASAKESIGQKTMISDEELCGIVPIHPYAALMLKHLSVVFSSNQRSMFDFIISNDADVKAFKWFIANYGPLDEQNLLTIDMLWDFFYGKGQNGLNDDVRVILDSYSLLNSEKLSPDEQRVMKTILLLQAISMRVSDVELLKPNGKNVDLAFGGTDWSKGKARSIAEKLVRDGILFKLTVAGSEPEYTVANSTGDHVTITRLKEEVRKETRTQDLVIQADLPGAVRLPASIDGRFVREPATAKNFAIAVNNLGARQAQDRFKVLITFAIDDEEAARLRGQIIAAIGTGKTDFIYIDAGLTPMGMDLFDQYVESMAYSRYYAKNDKRRAGEFQSQAERCLADWREKIQSGAFMLYDAGRPSGIRMANLAVLEDELASMNHQRYPYGLEQYNVIANMFAKGQLAKGAECGIKQELSQTFKAPNEKTSLAAALSGAWQVPEYWKDPAKGQLPIVKIKLEAEKMIEAGFSDRSGRVSMSDIYDVLTREPYGFMPNNISAFVLGFVLKEYADSGYFWSNGSNNEPLTADKMKMMIANAINQQVSPNKNFREEYIVEMSGDQRAFLECTAKAFAIPQNQCGSIESARDQIRISMKRFPFPIWCVKYALPQISHAAPDEKLSEIIDDYCNIANTANGGRGSESEIAADIGKAVIDDPRIAADLPGILTSENCQKGMLSYLSTFQGGTLRQLAAEIGDNGAYLDEVRAKFNSDAANWVWNTDTADDKIKDVILDYRIIIESNKSLPKCVSIKDVVRGWNARTNNIKLSYDAIKKSVGDLSGFLEMLHGMKIGGELPDQRKERFYDLLLSQREAFDRFYNDQAGTFRVVAASFLKDLDADEVEELFNGFPQGQFTKSATEYFNFVQQEIARFAQGQLKKRMRDLWREKTGTKDPAAWSYEYATPILCMFDDNERPKARRVFAIMHDKVPSEKDAGEALSYLEHGDFYDRLADPGERDRCFTERVIGDYAVLLGDVREVRSYLQNHTDEKPYHWIDNATIQNLIRSLADMRYKTGGYESAMNVVDRMDTDTLREYLRNLISDNVRVGIEILRHNGGRN